MDQVQVFRNASCQEYTRQQYYIFKDVYGYLSLHTDIDPKNPKDKERAKETYNSLNPFDINKNNFNRFNSYEIVLKKSANDFKDYFAEFLCDLWSEEFALKGFKEVKDELKKKSLQKKASKNVTSKIVSNDQRTPEIT